jgi:uncharacterized repeat protein (TIGR01451 family)
MRTKITLAAVSFALGLLACAPGAGAEEAAARWSINSLAVPTHFAPGGKGFYEVRVSNIGGAAADGTPLTVTDTLPAGLGVETVELPLNSGGVIVDKGPTQCTVENSGPSQLVTCTVPAALIESTPAKLGPSESLRMIVNVEIPPNAAGPLQNEVEVQGGGVAPAGATATNEATEAPVPQGFEEFSGVFTGADGQPVGAAATHPFQYITSFAANSTTPPPGSNLKIVPAGGDLKDIEVKLPPGFSGNPLAVKQCTARQFNTFTRTDAHAENECPDSSAVGLVLLRQVEGTGTTIGAPLYNLVPSQGMPAQLGFTISTLPFYIDTSLRTGSDYGISARLLNTSEAKRVVASAVVIWGVPSDPIHDTLRGHCVNNGLEGHSLSLGSCPATGAEEKPFLRLPTSCEQPLFSSMSFNIWPDPQSFSLASDEDPALTGCEEVGFEPSFSATPTATAADSPTGLEAEVHIPQTESLAQPATADLRKTVVTLPEGLVVNPSGANGLQACSPAQIGLTSAPGQSPPTFTAAAANCPDAAKVGTVEVKTPLLDHPLNGGVYVATPDENPFGSLLALYIAVSDPQTGVVLKLPGKVSPDLQTGRITATFDETPQQPFEDFKLSFTSGPQASLRTPALCANHTTHAQMTPWSAPGSGPPAELSSTFAITSGPGGGPCADSLAALPHQPSFDAGTLAPVAGAYSPFVLNLSRQDGSQELSSLSVSPPPGLIGKPAGIPYCPDEALAAAAGKSGQAELASPSCPGASQVGTVEVGAGAGPAPYFTGGRAYLAGPYKGAPLSLAIVTPAVAGPFDLGTVVVRTALRIDPETARLTADSDPLPQILQGIPLDVRSIAVKLDRPGFTLNPTDCEPLSFSGSVTSTSGQTASLSHGFQVDGCGALKFGPKLKIKLSGGTTRSAHPSLRAVLQMPPGGANIARVSVALPHSEFLDQSSIGTICTRVQFAAEACPKGSVYGHVTATSPLVDYKMEGLVYLRSSDHKLPDLVAVVRGPASQPIMIASDGRIDSVHGGIRTTFESFPDVPITKVVLSMRGGKRKGLIENSQDICKHRNRATARFTAQNAKTSAFRPLIEADCGKHKKKKK